MNFATWSIRNPTPAILLFVLLTMAGLWGFRNLPVQNFPDFDLPRVTVTATLPGAAPAQLETEVARRIEDSISTLDGLRHINTTITDGAVSLLVEFELEKSVSDALIETKDAVDRVRSDLPPDLLPPTVAAVTFSDGAVVTYAVASTRMDEEALSWFVDDTLARAVRTVPGVGRFERVGGVQREVRIEVDPVRLAALGVTAGDVSRALREVQQQSSGGRGQIGGAEQAIRTVAIAAQASELEALPITVAGGRRVRLDQVASVRDAAAERSQAALLNGQPAVGFSVLRAKGFDETEVASGVEAVLARIKAEDPSISLTRVSGTVDYTLEQYEGSMTMLVEGAILAVIVVFLFLRDWRATLIAAAALPLSILPTFAAMQFLGYSLNTLTLLAMAVIVGVLVDDAIVEIENIERHRRMGKPILKATEDAVTEIALAVFATTMCLVVVFLPTALMSGITGLVFKQFGWTAVIAVLASLLVARLLTPMMAAYFLKAEAAPETPDGLVMRRYLGAVQWCFAHRKTTAGAAIGFLLASLSLVPLLPTGFLPADNSGFTGVSVELPPGSALDRTVSVSEDVRRALAGVGGIAGVFTTVGEAQGEGDDGQQAGDVRRAALTLVLAPADERPTKTAIEAAVRQRLATIPGARFTIGGGDAETLELALAGDDARALKATAQGLERDLRGVPGLSNVNSTASLERPEIIIRPDLARAAELGVTTDEIGETVRIATSGDFDADVARLNLDNRQIYIRARVADSARRDLETLANLRVAGRNGLVPLGSVADLSIASGPSQIDRYDRRRAVTVSADLGDTALGEGVEAVAGLPSIKGKPSSVELIPTGDAEIAGEVVGGFATALVVGIVCVFFVLILLFKDVFQPLTILSAIPLSVGGAFVALLFAGGQINLPAMIGLVMLMGIVTKNSILLVEYAVIGIKERGLSRSEALLDACHKRARPIVMTTVAMIAGMAPLALGFGADSSFRQPMATAVIGGLLTSTALSLLVVPVVFTYVDGLERRVRRLFAGRRPQALTTPVFPLSPVSP